MWSEITGSKNERAGQRYTSDLSDPEWVLIEPWMKTRKKRLGRPRETRFARGDERDPVHAAQRLPVAYAGKGFSAVHDDAGSISTSGATTACSSGSVSNCWCRRAKLPAASRARRPG
jgi:hypothetical protein